MQPYAYALKEYGTKTIAGLLHNPEILKYFRDIGHSWVADDETAWCAAFLNWCLLQAGREQTRKLNARSFLSYGIKTETPVLGDIVVLWRISRTGPYGHCGFFVKETNDRIYILGGNQTGQVSIAPFDKTQLLEYRQLPKVCS